MFPEPVRNVTSTVSYGSLGLVQGAFKLGRAGLWVAATTFTVLILPIICEQERSSLEEQQAQQQRQLLLGPSAASPSAGAGGPGLMPGLPGIPFGAGAVAN